MFGDRARSRARVAFVALVAAVAGPTSALAGAGDARRVGRPPRSLATADELGRELFLDRRGRPRHLLEEDASPASEPAQHPRSVAEWLSRWGPVEVRGR